MSTISITNARNNLYRIVEDVNKTSEPVIITNNKGKNAVLISEDDWSAIEETLYLNSVPGLVNEILKDEPFDEREIYSRDEEW